MRFLRPITERSKMKQMQSQITFDGQSKIALSTDDAIPWWLFSVLNLRVFNCRRVTDQREQEQAENQEKEK